MKSSRWYCEVWRYHVHFFIGFPRAKFEEAFRRRYGGEPPGPKDREGGTYRHPSQPIVLVWTSTRKPSLLAHECLHATNFILESAGHKLSTENDEAQAYLLEAIVNRAEQVRRVTS